jgi:hypothetical protein
LKCDPETWSRPIVRRGYRTRIPEIGLLHHATGRPVLTAAAAGQFAHEGLIGPSGERHGVFTWAVLDALRNGDTNGNSSPSWSGMCRAWCRRLPQAWCGPQLPSRCSESRRHGSGRRAGISL